MKAIAEFIKKNNSYQIKMAPGYAEIGIRQTYDLKNNGLEFPEFTKVFLAAQDSLYEALGRDFISILSKNECRLKMEIQDKNAYYYLQCKTANTFHDLFSVTIKNKEPMKVVKKLEKMFKASKKKNHFDEGGTFFFYLDKNIETIELLIELMNNDFNDLDKVDDGESIYEVKKFTDFK